MAFTNPIPYSISVFLLIWMCALSALNKSYAIATPVGDSLTAHQTFYRRSPITLTSVPSVTGPTGPATTSQHPTSTSVYVSPTLIPKIVNAIDCGLHHVPSEACLKWLNEQKKHHKRNSGKDSNTQVASKSHIKVTGGSLMGMLAAGLGSTSAGHPQPTTPPNPLAPKNPKCFKNGKLKKSCTLLISRSKPLGNVDCTRPGSCLPSLFKRNAYPFLVLPANHELSIPARPMKKSPASIDLHSEVTPSGKPHPPDWVPFRKPASPLPNIRKRGLHYPASDGGALTARIVKYDYPDHPDCSGIPPPPSQLEWNPRIPSRAKRGEEIGLAFMIARNSQRRRDLKSMACEEAPFLGSQGCVSESKESRKPNRIRSCFLFPVRSELSPCFGSKRRDQRGLLVLWRSGPLAFIQNGITLALVVAFGKL